MHNDARIHSFFIIVFLQAKVNEVWSAPAFVPFDVNPFQEFYHAPTYEDIPHIPIGDPLELGFIDHMKTRPLADTDFIHTPHKQLRRMRDVEDGFRDDDVGDEDGGDDNENKKDKGEDKDDADDVDELTMAGLFEGDIVVYTKDELSNLVHGRRAHMRSALTPPEMLWPDGLVPYIIADTFSDHERRQIGAAMEAFHDLTCINFVPRGADHDDYIIIYQGKGCSSGVGRRGGPQSVSLASKCIKKDSYGTILHEFMHALGFEHEQARYDRDNHITINWDNINPKKRYNFGMRPSGPTTTLGLNYDYNSLMHYGSKFFAVNRSIDTIITDTDDVKIGNRIDFSELDLKGINALYQCPELNKTVNDDASSSEASDEVRDTTNKKDGSKEMSEEKNKEKKKVARDDEIYDEIIEENKKFAHDEEIDEEKFEEKKEVAEDDDIYDDIIEEKKKLVHDEEIDEEEHKENKRSSNNKINHKHETKTSGENSVNGSEENKISESDSKLKHKHGKKDDEENTEDENISKHKRKHKHSSKHHSKHKKRKKHRTHHKHHENVDEDEDVHDK